MKKLYLSPDSFAVGLVSKAPLLIGSIGKNDSDDTAVDDIDDVLTRQQYSMDDWSEDD